MLSFQISLTAAVNFLPTNVSEKSELPFGQKNEKKAYSFIFVSDNSMGNYDVGGANSVIELDK